MGRNSGDGKTCPIGSKQTTLAGFATDNAVHFYLKRSKGFARTEKLDMQMIDMGIALCHFDLTAKENNLDVVFEQNNPKLETDAEYIASCRLV